MSLNFGQFPTPTLPINAGDFVVGYQLLGTNGVPTLAQYTMTQLFTGVFPGGVVPVTQGGTGLTAVTTGSVLVGGTANVLNTAAPGAAGTVLVSQGVGQIPLFSNLIVTNGTTQGRLDNSTLVATDAFVNQQIASAKSTVPAAGVTGGVYNQASLGTGAQVVVFASGGIVTSILTIVNPGSGYAVGDLLILPAGNSDAIVRVTSISGGGVTAFGVVYGGTGYTTGIQTTAIDVPPGSRTVTFTGTLTSNLTFIIQRGTFLTASRTVQFNNNTTGAFTVTVFLSNGAGGTTGSGVVLPQGTNNSSAVAVETDGQTDVWLTNTPLGIGAFPNAGTTTNNNAGAGNVGEFITATGTAVSLTSGAATNVTSVSLTAGDWEVSGSLGVTPAAGTTMSAFVGGVSLTTATIPVFPGGVVLQTTFATGGQASFAAPPVRVSIAATTTVFMVVQANFAVSTCTGSAILRARRVR